MKGGNFKGWVQREIRVSSPEDMAHLVEEWGFVPLLRNEFPGFSVEEMTSPEQWFADDQDGPWEWKGPVIRKSGGVYGKYFLNRAMFVSGEWMPDFLNLRRDGYDFEGYYEDGKAGYGERLIYEALCAHGPMLSYELKWQAGFGKNGRRGFDAALAKLQMAGFVTVSNFEYRIDRKGQPYGWGIARYALPEQIFGEELEERISEREPEESRTRMLRHLAALMPEMDEAALRRITG